MKILACLLMLADRRFYFSDHSQSNFSLSRRVGNTPTRCGFITCYILWMEAAPPRSSEQTMWVLTSSSVCPTHVEPQAFLDIWGLEKQWRCSWVCIPNYSRIITWHLLGFQGFLAECSAGCRKRWSCISVRIRPPGPGFCSLFWCYSSPECIFCLLSHHHHSVLLFDKFPFFALYMLLICSSSAFHLFFICCSCASHLLFICV